MSLKGSAVFIDTSIAIARKVHAPSLRVLIEETLSGFEIVVTGTVVKQEYKRRLLKEAKYLLGVLNQYGSFRDAQRHVSEVLPPQSSGKKNICIETLQTIWEEGEAESDESLLDRARSYLRLLLLTGMGDFCDDMDVIVGAGCACAEYPITELEPYKRYGLGPEKCGECATCGVEPFLALKVEHVKRMLELLRSVPAKRKSEQIQRTEAALAQIAGGGTGVRDMQPCLKLGDLVIAMESADVPVFFTMNGKESQYLARSLGQDLVVRAPNWNRANAHCLASSKEWPEF